MIQKITTTITLILCASHLLTAQTPTLVKDLNPGTAHAFDSWNTKGVQIGNKVFLAANNGQTGMELYVLENDNVTLVKDINPGANGSTPQQFTLVGNKFYFTADDGAKGRELWESDGTEAGTKLRSDVVAGATGSSPEGLIADDSGNLYFSVPSEQTAWTCPTATNLTPTKLNLPDDVSFANDFNKASNVVCKYDGGIAFWVLNSRTVEIWTAKGTTVTKLGDVDTDSFFPDVYGFTTVAGGFVFAIEDSFKETNNGLYAYDATTKTTTRIVDGKAEPAKQPRRVVPLSASKAIFLGSKIYATDGTAAGTVEVYNDIPDILGGSALSSATWDGKALLHGATLTFKEAVVLTDGTLAGTSVAATAGESYLSDIFNQGGLAFWAAGVVNGFNCEIWHTNMATGTSKMLYYYNNVGSTQGESFLPIAHIGDQLYFISYLGGNTGYEIYKLKTTGIVAVDELDASAEYKIQRIRANERQFTIETEGNTETLQLQFFTLDGRLLSNQKVRTGETFNLPETGNIDFLMIQGEKGVFSVKVW